MKKKKQWRGIHITSQTHQIKIKLYSYSAFHANDKATQSASQDKTSIKSRDMQQDTKNKSSFPPHMDPPLHTDAHTHTRTRTHAHVGKVAWH